MTSQQLTFRNLKQEKNLYNETTRFEKIHTEIFEQSSEASKTVAHEIAELIREKNDSGKKCILGLATGSSPTSVYDELVRLHKEEGLSFKNVITFNLDGSSVKKNVIIAVMIAIIPAIIATIAAATTIPAPMFLRMAQNSLGRECEFESVTWYTS